MVVEYAPFPAFKNFTKWVTDNRRKGDVDENKSLLDVLSKLLSNSCYGKFLESGLNYQDTKIVQGMKPARKLINRSHFRQLTEFDNDIFEISSAQNSISQRHPLHVGIFIVDYAKIRLLSWVWNCVDKYVDSDSYEICYCDTDSALIALSDPSIAEAVKPELRDEFEREKHNWFVADHPPELKFQCSKNAMLSNDNETKIASKGVNKNQNKWENPYDLYNDVLKTGKSLWVVIRDFNVSIIL